MNTFFLIKVYPNGSTDSVKFEAAPGERYTGLRDRAAEAAKLFMKQNTRCTAFVAEAVRKYTSEVREDVV